MAIRSRLLQHTKLFTFTLAAASLAGCAQMGGETGEGTATPTDEAARPEATTICILPNTQLQGEQHQQMVAAVAAGIRASGLNTRELAAEGTPQSCQYCVAYNIAVQEQKLMGVQYQIFENGQPVLSASGPAHDGQLQLQMVASYAKQLMDHFIKLKNNPQAAQQPAQEAPAQPSAQ